MIKNNNLFVFFHCAMKFIGVFVGFLFAQLGN